MKEAIYEQLLPVWQTVLQKGCLTSDAAHLFKIVISVNDPKLFFKFTLQEIMKLRTEDDLNKAIDLLFGLFYFNLRDFTIALLNTLPQLLFKNDDSWMIEPQSMALARLTAYVICATVQEHSVTNTDSSDNDPTQNSDDRPPPAKKVCLSSESNSIPLSFISSAENDSSQNHMIIKDKMLMKSLTALFRAFDSIASRTGVVNPSIIFVFNIIRQIVECGKDVSLSILTDVSSTLIPNLIKLVPEMFSMELILKLYDLNSQTGMKTAVRDLCLLRNLTMKC